MTIHNFSIEYDAINSKNIFSNGDIINGRIILEASKEIKVEELTFKAQGYAEVCWDEYYERHSHWIYITKEKYYDSFHHILRGTEVIGPGRHVFPFSFQIPDKKMPSTFKSSVGKIVHKLKAELKQSMQLNKTAKTHFTFVSSPDMDIPGLWEPQHGYKYKTVSVFGSGTVAVDLYTERMGYNQGEALLVRAEIKNQSSREVKPKFILYQKKSYFAQGKRKVDTKDILKEKCDAVESGSNTTVTTTITVPKELLPSVLNCKIIKLEYRLKIHLDIKCATDPEVKLPIVVLPELSDTPGQKPFEKSKAMEASAQAHHYPLPLVSAQSNPSPGSSDDPPPYGAHSLYPPNTDHNRRHF